MASIELTATPFSQENLFQALTNPHASASEVAGRPQASYLFEYVSVLCADAGAEVGTGTIIVESPYTDADYLDDFTSYYARCFVSFSRSCKRLHFFAGHFALGAAENIKSGTLSKEEVKQLRAEYLGFVVARPLPQALIGRTALRTFATDGGRRNYTCKKQYIANLVGIELSVDSLAFQEQDTVLAACATVALWTSFQKAANLFGTTAPTPSVITRASQSFHYGRSFPSQGLSVLEMCAAIRHAGLEPEVVDVENIGEKPVPLLSLLYAHLQLGVPVVLVADVPAGRHAIALVGYSLREQRVHEMEVPGSSSASVPMAGLRIDKFFGHDDQVGPFCRMNVQISGEGSEFSIQLLRGESVVRPVAVVAPIYNKIRLTFLDVHKWLTRLNQVVKLLLPDLGYEWDVALLFSNDYKASVRDSEFASAELKRLILTSSQPRFIWRCALKSKGTDLLHVVFDATGIARSFPVYMVAWWHRGLADVLRSVFSQTIAETAFRSALTDRFFDLLRGGLNSGEPIVFASDGAGPLE